MSCTRKDCKARWGEPDRAARSRVQQPDPDRIVPKYQSGSLGSLPLSGGAPNTSYSPASWSCATPYTSSSRISRPTEVSPNRLRGKRATLRCACDVNHLARTVPDPPTAMTPTGDGLNVLRHRSAGKQHDHRKNNPQHFGKHEICLGSFLSQSGNLLDFSRPLRTYVEKSIP